LFSINVCCRWVLSRYAPSVITSKAANRYQFKTGQDVRHIGGCPARLANFGVADDTSVLLPHASIDGDTLAGSVRVETRLDIEWKGV
jgi:hypothetical protein